MRPAYRGDGQKMTKREGKGKEGENRGEKGGGKIKM